MGRARRRVLVCDMGSPRNAPAAEMRGFISRDGASPSAFLKTAALRAEAVPSVQLNASACVAARSDGQQRFHIALENGEQHAGRRLLSQPVSSTCCPRFRDSRRCGAVAFSFAPTAMVGKSKTGG